MHKENGEYFNSKKTSISVFIAPKDLSTSLSQTQIRIS